MIFQYDLFLKIQVFRSHFGFMIYFLKIKYENR
jgi:hypothetical protein